MNSSGKFLVNIFSDANFLALNILENLLDKNCFVNVVTSDKNNWVKLTSTVSFNERFKIIPLLKFTETEKSSANIFCNGFFNKDNAYENYKSYLSKVHSFETKSIAIFPFEVFSKNKIIVTDSTAIVYTGDLIGSRINLNSNLYVSKMLKEILDKRKITLGSEQVVYPININDFTKLITKWLFSFGPYGKETLVIGREVTIEDFWKINQKLVGKIILSYDLNRTQRKILEETNIEVLNCNLEKTLIDTYLYLIEVQTKPAVKVKPKKVQIRREKIVIPKYVKPVFLFSALILLFPIVMLLVSMSISAVGIKMFKSGNANGAINSMYVAKSLATIAEKESQLLSYVPVVNIPYKEILFTSTVIVRANDIGVHLIPIISNGAEQIRFSLGEGTSKSTDQISTISLNLNLLHNDLVRLKESTDVAITKKTYLAKELSAKLDFDKYINLVYQGKIIVDNLPEMLGSNGLKTYLLLFQNNMELRPTGGFIGSFGLLTLDNGRMSDLTVSDVYSADGQLNGHVEPPLPIKNYLGEANWWLRDSNWDPDFPTSAKRAEWFLDKEIGKKVDGVIAIDLSPIKELLKVTGPIYLPDFDMDITSDNLYEKTQNEVQNNSFPGTHQKASFLTALSRNILTVLLKLDSSQQISILRTFYNSLESRNIQLFMNDSSTQGALSSIGWDGSVEMSACGERCYADTVGIVEANVGVNKANYFVQRNAKLYVEIDKEQIKRTLILSLKNDANSDLGLAGKYKAYIRLLIPLKSEVLSVVASNIMNQTDLPPDITEIKDRKEVGVLVEVLGGQSTDLTFSWKSDVSNLSLSDYLIYIRKQAGVDLLPLSLTISIPSLTDGLPYLYNANLTRDYSSRFSLK